MTIKQYNPFSLKQICSSVIVQHQLGLPDQHQQDAVNEYVKSKWEEIKRLAAKEQDSSLLQLMQGIEYSVVTSGEEEGFLPQIALEADKGQLLHANAYTLFRELNRSFPGQAEGACPLDYDSYHHGMAQLMDKSLVEMWKRAKYLFTFTGQQPVTANEIRAWLQDPANKGQLNRVEVLHLSDLKLKVIPPEIQCFPRLTCLQLHRNDLADISALGNLPQLTTLYLANNQLSDISPLAKLTNLRDLRLENNKIVDISPLAGLHELDSIALSENNIADISALAGLEKLMHIELGKNRITDISALEGQLLFNKGRHYLQTLHLFGNPLLFVFGSQLSMMTYDSPKSIILRHLELKDYHCLSPFSALCKSIIFNADPEAVKEAFNALKIEDKNLIYGMVYEESKLRSESDPIWGQNHVFDDMNIFKRAVRTAVDAKINQLSQEDKNKVYGAIYQLANPSTNDPKWGERHALDHTLRFLDAMDKAGF